MLTIKTVASKLISPFGTVIRDFTINVVAASVFWPPYMRCFLYRAVGMKVQTYKIYPRCFFGGTRIRIGRGTIVSYNCFFDASAPITIGNGCAIADNVQFCTSTHAIGTCDRRAGDRIVRPICVEDGCWIGTRAIILPGITIGAGCVIAAGALVLHDCEPNGLYAGVPAKRMRDLTVHDERLESPLEETH